MPFKAPKSNTAANHLDPLSFLVFRPDTRGRPKSRGGERLSAPGGNGEGAKHPRLEAYLGDVLGDGAIAERAHRFVA